MEERKDTTGLGDTGKCANDTFVYCTYDIYQTREVVAMSEKVVS